MSSASADTWQLAAQSSLCAKRDWDARVPKKFHAFISPPKNSDAA
jgi:hypothetical protein